MAFNGSGTFNRIYNWTTDAGNGINIEASRMDGEDNGFATGLSNCITKDGQTTITANIPFNSKKITGLANGSARTDSIALGQVQDNSYGTLGTLGGSANTYTASPSPAITSYVAGMEFNFKVNATNTGASTLNISELGAENIKKYSTGSKVDIEAGDLQQNKYNKVIFDGTDYILDNPEAPTVNLTKSTTTASGISYLPKQITISNGTDSDHDIDFTAGNFNFDDGTGQAVATYGLTKQLDGSWAAGNGAGGLDTGSIAADTTYYMFAIWNPTTSAADFLFSASHVSPGLPSGYTKKKRIAALRTDGSSNIRNGKYIFNPDGSYHFEYATKILDLAIAGSAATSKTNFTVTVPRDTIVKVRASMYRANATDAYVNLLSPYDNSLSPTFANADLLSDIGYLGAIEKNILSNDSGQISYISNSSTLDYFNVTTLGWFDSIKQY
jgi:hypothetical protein